MYHDLIQTFNWLCGNQHMHHDLLQAFNRLWNSQTGLPNTYKPNFYKLSTVFVAVKTRLTNHQVFIKPCDG